MFTCNPADELEVEQMILWRKQNSTPYEVKK